MVEDAISFWTDIQRYEDKLAADPRSLCFVELSELYRKLGLLDDAVSVAKKGSDLHPDHAPGLYALGTACHAKGLGREAREALERTLELEPGHLEAARLLAQLYIEAGELARAAKLLQEILRQHPDDVESELLLRSIGGEGRSEAFEEEQLEEVELIEELTEVLDEPQEEAAPVALEEPAVAKAVPAPAVAASDPFAVFEEESPLWDVQPPEASPSSDRSEESDYSDDWSDFLAPPAAAEPGAAHPARDPLATATLAELYVTQGFIEKALGIYRELSGADPGNHAYRSRCAELGELQKAQAEPPGGAGAPQAAAAPPLAAYAESPPAYAEPPAAYAEPPAAYAEPPAAYAEPPAAVSPAKPPALQAASGDEFEKELGQWLENIRRRRDGV